MSKPCINWQGWLWFDNSADALEQKIARAAERYAAKFGRRPTVCYVHPGALNGEQSPNGLAVMAARNVLKHHFWLGIMEGESHERATDSV